MSLLLHRMTTRRGATLKPRSAADCLARDSGTFFPGRLRDLARKPRATARSTEDACGPAGRALRKRNAVAAASLESNREPRPQNHGSRGAEEAQSHQCARTWAERTDCCLMKSWVIPINKVWRPKVSFFAVQRQSASSAICCHALG